MKLYGSEQYQTEPVYWVHDRSDRLSHNAAEPSLSLDLYMYLGSRAEEHVVFRLLRDIRPSF